MDKRYAIFDMDGTLVDSMVYWKQLAGEFLRQKGVRHIPSNLLEQIKPMTIPPIMSLSISIRRRSRGTFCFSATTGQYKCCRKILSIFRRTGTTHE